MELTVAQFAKEIGVVPSRVRQMILAGEIKARHLTPRMLMIDAKELGKVPKDRRPGPKVRIRKPGRPRKK